MTAADLLSALDLPASSRVDRRVAKTLLTEHGAPTVADGRRLNQGIEECRWVAALKPTTVAVPAYRDSVREYLEIAVLRLILRPAAKAPRLVELVHRAVPYPVLLVLDAPSFGLSLAHKRWSQGEAGRTVLDGDVVHLTWDYTVDTVQEPAFLRALALDKQPRTTLYALHQGWIDTLLAFAAARRTGTFALPPSPERAAARRTALQACARLDAEIARIRAAAGREKQLPRSVDLNLELKRTEAALAVAVAQL